MLQGKRILLGVSGGIAAYKAVTLCSRLVQAGAEVRVILTASAAKFVTPLTFQTMSRHEVASDTFEERDPQGVMHIDWADWAEIAVIAPATANIIGKYANGIADDMLSTTLLAVTAPILAAPAMNVHMYEHPAVVNNMNVLQERGVRFVEPGEGQLACGYIGKGRLAEPETIIGAIMDILCPDLPLLGKKVMVTAGGTREAIDPVRYITNESSGKMGYALAEAAKQLGAEVTLIAANVQLPPPAGVRVIPVVTAQQMYDAAVEQFDLADIAVKAAAVSDYRPVKIHTHKIKKSDERMTIELERTEDILAELGRRKSPQQLLIGFAAETERLEEYAADKLRRKQCDLVAANNITLPGAGFGSDTNIITIIGPEGIVERLGMMAKSTAARRMMQLAAERLAAKQGSGPL